MVFSITYRRPAHVDPSACSLNSEKSDRPESVSSETSGPYGIPAPLSFDAIIAGGTCPPCTLRDFMNYLLYIENSAENLQFYLWFRDYVQRFDQLPESEKTLSPEWPGEKTKPELSQAPTAAQPNIINHDRYKTDARQAVAEAISGTEFDSSRSKLSPDPFNDPPASRSSDRASIVPSTAAWCEDCPSVSAAAISHTEKTSDAFLTAKTFQPFTIQPFREEISRIIAAYISHEGSRRLNLYGKEADDLLHALSVTTHPSAFRHVIRTIQRTLRHQAHPNFIRYTICNGNPPRVIFARGLGITGILGGLSCAIILTLSSASRGWRAISALGFLFGIATMIAAWKGMCVVLHGMHHRHLRPWELFASDDDFDQEARKSSMESLGSNNSYESEPWVAKYEKRNMVRKVFDRQVWIQEPALRQIQDTIFLQAILGAVVFTAVAMAIVIPLPAGNYF